MVKNSSFKVKLGTRSQNDLPEKGAIQFDSDTGLPVMGDGVKWVPIERTRASVGVRLTTPVLQGLAANTPEEIRYYDSISYQVLNDFGVSTTPGTAILVTEPMAFDAMSELDISSSKNSTVFTVYTYMGATLISTRVIQTGTKDIPVSFVGLGPVVISAAHPLRLEIESDKNCDLTIHGATVILSRRPD